jgi:hypothetical protein
MQTSDPVHAYLDAIRDYDNKTATASELIKDMGIAANAMQYHLEDFLQLTYGLPMPMGGSRGYRVDQSARLNMNQWPDSQKIKVTLEQWHASFMRLREAWGKVPDGARSGLRAPPQKLSTK